MSHERTRLHPRTQDLTGLPFDRWTVIAFAYYSDGNAYWTCQCSCPAKTIKDCAASTLTHRTSKSCGCLRDEMLPLLHRTHGMTKTPEYKAWQQMFVRCYSPKAKSFKDYGARGITVCTQWHGSFETFFADMGPRPTPQHSLERLNNNQGYTPDNCHWVTMKQQGNNRRTNRLMTHNGLTKTLTQWAESTGQSLQGFRQRLLAGMSFEEALTTPVRALTASSLHTTHTLHGETHTIAEWAQQAGMSYTTLYRRLLRGKTLEQALAKPAALQKRPHTSYPSRTKAL